MARDLERFRVKKILNKLLIYYPENKGNVMTYNKILSTLLLLFLLSSCAEKSDMGSTSGSVTSERSSTARQKNEATKYLAYVHDLKVEIDSGQVADTHSRIVQACDTDELYSCVVLDASISLSRYQRSTIQLRLKPEGVAHFSSLANEGGTISSQSSRAEDLSDSIVDNIKRIEMLESYRDKLQALEAKPNDDIESLVKIASELSSVQNDLEFAQGKGAKLLQRVETDILNIQLTAPVNRSFWQPITDSLGDFGSQLSYGIATVITSSAYLLPWAIFLIILFFILRRLYKFIRK